MAPGNDIFDETREIPVVWESLERLCKKVMAGVTPVTCTAIQSALSAISMDSNDSGGNMQYLLDTKAVQLQKAPQQDPGAF